VGTEERENEIRMVSVFKHPHEASVPRLHSLRWNIPLALGNRHHLRSGCPPFPLGCGNQTDPLPQVKDEKDFRSLEPAAYLTKGQVKPAGLFLHALDKSYVLLRVDAEGEL
jgi:hypothetical protein